MTEAERQAALDRIADEVRGCTRCRLHEGRTQAVPGEGHPSTEVLFVGEAPGLNEDRQGRPFVGAAGQLLTELIESIGWRRDEVFITNVVKCRPPQNRDPEPDEIEACAPFLRRQAEALEPALVVTLGRHSMGRFMPGARIGQVHGTHRPAPEGSPIEGSLVYAMYHPAAALHQGSLKATLADDMAGIPAALLEARGRREAASTGPAATTETVAPPDEPQAAGPPEPAMDASAGPAVGADAGRTVPETAAETAVSQDATDPAPAEADTAPAEPDTAPTEPDTAPTEPDTAPTEPATALEAAVPVRPEPVAIAVDEALAAPVLAAADPDDDQMTLF